MQFDINFFDANLESIGETLKNVSFNPRSYEALSRLFDKIDGAVPIEKLSQGVLLALIQHGGIPKGARFIQS